MTTRPVHDTSCRGVPAWLLGLCLPTSAPLRPRSAHLLQESCPRDVLLRSPTMSYVLATNVPTSRNLLQTTHPLRHS